MRRVVWFSCRRRRVLDRAHGPRRAVPARALPSRASRPGLRAPRRPPGADRKPDLHGRLRPAAAVTALAPRAPGAYIPGVPPVCPYCDRPARLATGRERWPARRDLASVRVWVCDPCGASVGCHVGTDRPLGTLANAYLRDARRRAHAALDPLWRGGARSRSDVYVWLARRLRIPANLCHIATFDADLCEDAVRAVLRRCPVEFASGALLCRLDAGHYGAHVAASGGSVWCAS